MADYFPLIRRAIEALPEGGTSEQRQAIYERARDALMRQLRSVEPALPETHIERERLQLEDAVSRLEADIAQEAADELNPQPEPPAPARRTAPAPAAGGMRLQAPPDIANDDAAADATPGRRPRVPFAGSEPEPPKRRSFIGIIIAAGLPIIIGIAVAAYILRDPPDRFRTTLQAAQGTTASSASEVANTSSRQTRPSPPAQPEIPPEPAIPVAVRASLYEENASNPQQRLERRGAVVWRVEPDSIEGAPASQRIKGDIEIPDVGLNVEFIVRRNIDPTFPASHTLNLRFIPVSRDAPVIKSIALPEFRENPLAKGPVLQGVNATVQDNEFLVALFNGEPMQSTNIDLLKRPGWLDFELRFADGRRGELVFEKGVAGERAFAAAFASWGQ